MTDPNQHRNAFRKPGCLILCIVLGLILCGVILWILSSSSRAPAAEPPVQTEVVEETSATLISEETTAETQSEPGRFQFQPGEEALVFEENLLLNGDKTFNSRNQHNAEVQCYYPVFSGLEAAEAINTDVYRIAQAYVNTYSQAEIRKSHSAYGMAFTFSHIGYIEATYHGSGLLSIVLDYSGFWGEDSIYDHCRTGYVYSLATGERMTLTELTGLSEEQLLPVLQSHADRSIQDHLKNNPSLQITDRSLLAPEALTLDDFGFYIAEDGQLYATLNGIHTRKEEPARGYWESFYFPVDVSNP